MNARKIKFILFGVFALFIFFFTNDFGLIDVEKTSIITAIAIDKEGEDYSVTAQIAVPEATDANTENTKTQITGTGSTIGRAIKNLGNYTGWFPKLTFCNLILLGEEMANTNVIEVLDYFAKTLRVQDSAQVALTQGKAKELLAKATPLDNISAFALQKIMLKKTGFDKDVASTDIKTFCVGHYSRSASSFMPVIKAIPVEDKGSSTQGGGGQGQTGQNSKSSTQQEKYTFDARTTALFKDGVKVGELPSQLTLTYNAIFTRFNGTALSVEDVIINGQKANCLLSVQRARSRVKLRADQNNLVLTIKLNLYCKISDVNAQGTDFSLAQNSPIPDNVKEKVQNTITQNVNDLLETSRQTGCDLLRIKEKLYRFNYKQYSRYKDNYLSMVELKPQVTIIGQH